MKSFIYKSPIGMFAIKSGSDGRWNLWFKDDVLGSYHSAMAAADDVYTQATGNYEWDTLEGADIPSDIAEWVVSAS